MHFPKIPLFAALLLLLSFLPFQVMAKSARPLVLIVHSYEKNHVCGQPQADGVIEVLKEKGLYPEKVDVEEFFMDTKKTYTSPEAVAQRGRAAMKRIQEKRPLIVVPLDDNAFKEVGLPLAGKPGVSVVFCGVNGQPEDFDTQKEFMETREHPGHNITGVYEKLHLKRALNVVHKAVAGVNKIVGITDFSPTGNAITRQFALEAEEGLPVQWEVRRVKNFAEYKKLINRLNDDTTVQAIYPVALTLPTEDNSRVTAPEIFRWTLNHSRKPEIPLNYYFCKLGLFGGASVNFESMGRQAGEQVTAILEGTPAGELSIVDARDYAIVFNLARARELGITIPEEILLASDSVFTSMDLKPVPTGQP